MFVKLKQYERDLDVYVNTRYVTMLTPLRLGSDIAATRVALGDRSVDVQGSPEEVALQLDLPLMKAIPVPPAEEATKIP